MDIVKSLMGSLTDPKALSKLASSVNGNESQVKSLVETALPTLMQAVNNNASSKSGLSALSKALDQHSDDDTSDMASFLDNIDMSDASKMLGHILGNKAGSVESKLAAQSGLDIGSVTSILTQLAPSLLSTLGQTNKKSSLDLSSIIQGESSSDLIGVASQFLDSDGDGDIMDDLGKLASGFLKK